MEEIVIAVCGGGFLGIGIVVFFAYLVSRGNYVAPHED